nr:hypothetical protein [Ruminiclostridium sp.]
YSMDEVNGGYVTGYDPDRVPPRFREMSRRFAVLGNMKFREAWFNYTGRQRRYFDGTVFSEAHLNDYPIFSSTLHSLHRLYDDLELDYLIIDECSLMKRYHGLTGMCRTKHIILVGDENQLQPVITAPMLAKLNSVKRDLHHTYPREELKEIYLGEGSFMAACDGLFGDSASRVLLNEHYRCHPSIAAFFNKTIYNDELDIKTNDDGQFRVRVKWYEGDYFEREAETNRDNDYVEIDADDQTEADEAPMTGRVVKSKKLNRRQTDIFIREELPELRAMLEAYPTRSACVICPHKDPIEVLKQELDRLDEEERDRIAALEGEGNAGDDDGGEQTGFYNAAYGDAAALTEEDLNVYGQLSSLTIHKSQGKTYDYVYILTCRDDVDSMSASSVWGQEFRMVNVSVSRARREVCVITSSRWLPPLPPVTGFRALPADYSRPGYGLSYDHRTLLANPNDFFMIRLFRYVKDAYSDPKYSGLLDGRDYGGRFGFHKSGITSVFDRVPEYKRRYNTRTTMSTFRDSALELCLYDELERRLPDDVSVIRELPLSALPHSSIHDRYARLYRLDFAVCRGNRFLFGIEVQGQYHRYNPNAGKLAEQRNKDEYKHRFLRDCFDTDEPPVLYFNADGSTSDEYDSDEDYGIKKLLTERLNELKHHNDAAVPELIRDSYNTEAIERALTADVFARRLARAAGSLDKLTYGLSGTGLAAMSGDNVRFGELYGLCRYGAVRAFDYSIMYSVIFSDLGRDPAADIIHILSLGAGSFLDGWAAKYASLSPYEPITHGMQYIISYTGAEPREREYRFVEQGMNGNMSAELVGEDMLRVLVERGNSFTGDDKSADIPLVLMFPEPLNNMPPAQFDLLTGILGELVYSRRTLYICVLHDITAEADGADPAERIVSAVNHDGSFADICSDIRELVGRDAYEEFERAVIDRAGENDNALNGSEEQPDLTKKLAPVGRNGARADPSVSYWRPRYCGKKLDVPLTDINKDFRNYDGERLLHELKERCGSLGEAVTCAGGTAFRVIRLSKSGKTR